METALSKWLLLSLGATLALDGNLRRVPIHQYLAKVFVVKDALEDASLSSIRPTTVPINIRSNTSRKFSMVLFWAWAAHLGVGNPGLLKLIKEK